MEMTLDNKTKTKRASFFSWPLFKQSFKANWVLWVALTAGLLTILVIINIVIGSRRIFTNIDMDSVTSYVKYQGMSWLQILGLLEQMGFSLSRIQIMSQIDMNSILNDLVYKIAGTLLPLIYIILISHKLVSAQVNDGSLAYVLSSPTNRSKVIRTQYLYLFLSLIAMYLVSTVGSVVSELIGYGLARAIPLRTVLYNVASFSVMVALSGICFFSSSFFTKGKYALAFGGTICVISFLANILGLFGSKVFVSVGVGVEAMNVFNYVSFISLFDTESISNFAKAVLNLDGGFMDYAWLWKCAILLVVGFAFAFVGSWRFVKKDLPL